VVKWWQTAFEDQARAMEVSGVDQPLLLNKSNATLAGLVRIILVFKKINHIFHIF
jgi:hypothetical protein